MIGIEQYQKIQEYKTLGLTETKTAKVLGITYSSVSKYWNMSKEDYAREAEKERYHMDNYRQYILEQLKICPQIRDTNVYLKLMEAFPDLQVKRATFYRYMKALREQHGYQHASKRKNSPSEISPPGYEAQADFGQYKLKDMYGRTVRVYFFCMVLSYSRMKYVYFSPDPFTTQTAIKAHNYAFQYFGGRPQTILYDLDRVYVISENLGNIIFVPAFEEYVKRTGYSVSLCRPRDPQNKGKVELEIRARQKHTKLRKASKLPNKAFDASKLSKGLKWQIKQLSNLTWLKEEQNLILLGKCGTGKSGLAAQLGETAISNGHKTYYAPFDNFIAVAEKKPQIQK